MITLCNYLGLSFESVGVAVDILIGGLLISQMFLAFSQYHLVRSQGHLIKCVESIKNRYV